MLQPQINPRYWTQWVSVSGLWPRPIRDRRSLIDELLCGWENWLLKHFNFVDFLSFLFTVSVLWNFLTDNELSCELNQKLLNKCWSNVKVESLQLLHAEWTFGVRTSTDLVLMWMFWFPSFDNLNDLSGGGRNRLICVSSSENCYSLCVCVPHGAWVRWKPSATKLNLDSW